MDTGEVRLLFTLSSLGSCFETGHPLSPAVLDRNWGNARTTVCEALLSRFRKILDDQGLLRRPSLYVFQAVMLYSLLVNSSDESNTKHESGDGESVILLRRHCVS